jgi:hypothetical protein
MRFSKNELAENDGGGGSGSVYRRYGYDSVRAARFVLAKAGPLRDVCWMSGREGTICRPIGQTGGTVVTWTKAPANNGMRG